MYIYYILLVLLIIIYFLVKSTQPTVFKSRKKSKPFLTKLVYTDTKSEKYDSILLKSNKYKLRGKPDIIYKSRFTRKYYPIELKSGKLGESAKVPRDGDLMQLCAYFFIVEEHYNCKVPYGKLVYKDSIFIVKNNRYMKRNFLTVLKNMRNFSVDKSNYSPNKKTCNACTLRFTVCEYKCTN